jgi:hypothetical protein
VLHRGERIDFEPFPCSGPDKAELVPCCRELIPCSVAQGSHLASNLKAIADYQTGPSIEVSTEEATKALEEAKVFVGHITHLPLDTDHTRDRGSKRPLTPPPVALAPARAMSR